MTPIKERLTKSGLIALLAEQTEYTRSEVKLVLDCLEEAILASLHPKGCGEFTLPGLLKIKTKKMPAVKGGQKKTSPFTGEPYVTKSRPASVKVKALTLVKVKAAANGKAG